MPRIFYKMKQIMKSNFAWFSWNLSASLGCRQSSTSPSWCCFSKSRPSCNSCRSSLPMARLRSPARSPRTLCLKSSRKRCFQCGRISTGVVKSRKFWHEALTNCCMAKPLRILMTKLSKSTIVPLTDQLALWSHSPSALCLTCSLH